MENIQRIALLCFLPVVATTDSVYVPGKGSGCKRPTRSEGLIIGDSLRVVEVGGTLRVGCTPGFTLQGPSTIRCVGNNIWDPPTPPSCERVTCDTPRIDHLGTALSRSYNAGHNVKLYCQDGYSLQYGNEVFNELDVTCGIAGLWLTRYGSVLPTCTLIKRCSPPPAVEHSSSYLSQQASHSIQEVEHGTAAMYDCNKPYQLVGRSKLKCVSGEWRGELPQCVISSACPRPDNIKYGDFDIPYEQKMDGTAGYRSGAKIIYVCREGYSLVGSPHRICQAGQWIGKMPKCIPSGCQRPEEIPNGGYNLFGHNDTTGMWVAEGSQIYYFCHSGYKLSQGQVPTKRECLAGHWTGEAPTCLKRTHCDLPQEIPNGNYVIDDLYPDTTSYGIGTRIKYECDEGFLAYGPVTLRCTSSGYWSDYPPKCIEKDQYCPHPGKVEHGNFVCPEGCGMYKVSTRLHYICDDNYEPIGLVKQTCLQGGTWSAEKPTCAPVPVMEMSGNLIEINAKPTTVVIATSCSVLGLLLIVMLIVALQRHKKPTNRLCSPLGQPPPPPYSRPRPPETMDELDRVALIAFADGVQVTLPSYDEAIRGRLGSRYISEVTGMRRPSSSSEYRPLPNIPVNLRNIADHHRNSVITTTSSTTRDNLSLAFGSMDTVNVSDGTSTTITVDTLDSGASNPSLALSQRAVAGSIASSNGSISNVNEDAPLLDQHSSENSGVQSRSHSVESPCEEPKVE